MQDLMITKTKDHHEKQALYEGLQALKAGKVSKIFKTPKEAVEFLNILRYQNETAI